MSLKPKSKPKLKIGNSYDHPIPVVGELITKVTCPNCEATLYRNGDISYTIIVCKYCKTKLQLKHV